MGCSRGLLLEGPAQQHGDLFVGDRARAAWAKLIVNTLETMFDKALPPLAHRRLGPGQTLRDLLVGNAFGGQQHQPGTRYKSMSKTAGSGKTRQFAPLLRSQLQSRQRTSE